VTGEPDIKDTTRGHSYKFVEALVDIACPGYHFRTIVQDVSFAFCQFFCNVDLDLDLESPKSISTILETHASYDEYLEISGFLQDKHDIKSDSIEIVL
jgi:hypothetical protein